MRKIFSIFLIAIGIFTISYPKIRVIYRNYKQKQIVEAWQKSIKNVDDYGEVYKKTNNKYLDNNIKNKNKENVLDKEKDFLREDIKNLAEGMLSIEKIDLRLPIIKGETNDNLNISVCSLDNCGEIGKEGNYIIAGHRSRSYGSLFNRLDELQIGDEIKVYNNKETYIYKVYEKVYVDPENIEPLKAIEKEKIISLVTCDYSATYTKRLIIHGKIK